MELGIDKFDSMKEVKFETYASLRIRGSILDQIRKMDWIPRTIRQKQKKIDAAMKEIETVTGRTATDEEIAQKLEISDLHVWRIGEQRYAAIIGLATTQTESVSALRDSLAQMDKLVHLTIDQV